MADLTLTGSTAFTASTEPAFGQVLSSGGASAGTGVVSSGTFAVECRINIASATGETDVFVGQPEAFWLGIDASGNLLGRYGSGGSIVAFDTTTNITGGVKHVALSVDATNGGKLYVDGVEVDSSATTPASAGSSYAGEFTIREGFGAGFNFGGTVDEVAVWSIDKYPAAFTAPTSPYSGTEFGLQNLWHLDGSGTDSAGGPEINVLPNDSALIYSPYNWKVEVSQAKTINTGAYIRTIIDGASMVLAFDTTGLTGDYPWIAVRVDGRTISRYQVSDFVIVNLPSNDTSKHYIEIYFDAINRTSNRWEGIEVACIFKGIGLDGGSAEKPAERSNKLLVYGDSITEGVKTFDGAVSVLSNSAIQSWALKVGEQLNAEVGLVGFGSQGFNSSGIGGVPNFAGAYDELWNGEPRDFSDPPNLCLWLMGTNDGTNNVTANGLAAINGQLSAMAGTKFVLLRPLIDNSQEVNLQTIASTCDDPSRVRYQTTDGFWALSESSDNLHPYGWACQAKIAPNITNVVEQDMGDIFTGTPSTANLSISGVPDGAYKTVLFDDSDNEVFRGAVTYASGSASLVNFQALAGTALEGFVIDNESPHVNGAVITGVTV